MYFKAPITQLSKLFFYQIKVNTCTWITNTAISEPSSLFKSTLWLGGCKYSCCYVVSHDKKKYFPYHSLAYYCFLLQVGACWVIVVSQKAWSWDSEKSRCRSQCPSSHMMLEMSSTVEHVIIANILKAVTVLGIEQVNLLTCLIVTTGMRISTVNHILQGKLKHRDVTFKRLPSKRWNLDLNPRRLFSKPCAPNYYTVFSVCGIIRIKWGGTFKMAEE